MKYTPDRYADWLLARQFGVITRADARACGLTDDQVDHRLEIGRWRVHARGVYVAAAVPPSWQQLAYAACRAGPRGTVASHLTAAALEGLGDAPVLPHVTVPPTHSARLRVARLHRAALDPVDITFRSSIPCTAVARTLVDCAALVGFDALAGLVDPALCRSLTTPDGVRAAMARASARPGRAGLPLLTKVLAVWTPGPLPGSPAEMRAIRRIVEWGFPVPERQHEVRGPGGFRAKIDLAWPDRKVGLEYDGGETHTPRNAAADRWREDTLRALGWAMVRARSRDIRPRSIRVRAALTEAFAAAAA